MIDWVRWEIRPWHQADGVIGGIIMFTEVITERKQAKGGQEGEQYVLRERLAQNCGHRRPGSFIRFGCARTALPAILI